MRNAHHRTDLMTVDAFVVGKLFLPRYRFPNLAKALRSAFSLPRRARLVALLVPRRFWYRTALYLSRLQGIVMERFRGGNAKLTEALMLDHWLRELTFSGAFPIPMRVVETEWLAQRELKIARLFCWTHLPLIEMPLRAMLRLNFPPFVMVAQPGKIVGANKDEFLAPGLQERIPAIPVGADVLTKVRGILREGGSVACLADARMGGPLLPHVMRIAARMGARLVFQWAERQPNGDILVTFIDAPRPLCENAEAIRENLEYLRMANRRVLDLLGLPPGSPE